MVSIHPKEAKSAFNVKTELADIVQAIVEMPAEVIRDQVSEIESARQLVAIVDVATLEENGVSLQITCAKSGQPLHAYTIFEYMTLKNIHGEERATYIMQAKQFSQIAPQWLYTDHTALEQLSKHDPYGYCVFALSNLLFPFQRIKNLHEAPFEIQLDWHDQKAKGYLQAQKVPLDKIVELNEMLRRYLAIVLPGKQAAKFTHRRIDLAIEDFHLTIEEIKENLTALVLKEMEKGRISEYVSYSDMVELTHLYQGMKAFRLQKKPREKSEMDMVQDIIMSALEGESLPRFMTGHEPTFTKVNPGKANRYDSEDIEEAMSRALDKLQAETSPTANNAPKQVKRSFAEMCALRRL